MSYSCQMKKKSTINSHPTAETYLDLLWRRGFRFRYRKSSTTTPTTTSTSCYCTACWQRSKAPEPGWSPTASYPHPASPPRIRTRDRCSPSTHPSPRPTGSCGGVGDRLRTCPCASATPPRDACRASTSAACREAAAAPGASTLPLGLTESSSWAPRFSGFLQKILECIREVYIDYWVLAAGGIPSEVWTLFFGCHL